MSKKKKKKDRKKKRGFSKVADAPIIIRNSLRDPGSTHEPILEEGKSVLLTMTGELYQLARIYFQVSEFDRLIERFNSVRCIVNDPPNNRWVWLYENEARSLKFENTYSSIPRSRRPIVLGSFFFRSRTEAYLNTNSFDRVTKAIEFFDEHIDRAVLNMTEMTIVNKLFDAYLERHPSHEEYIDQGMANRRTPESLLVQAAEIASTVLDPIRRAEMVMSLLQKRLEAPLPLVETHSLDAYYEDGISSINLPLTTRRIIAIRHLEGNTDYTMADAVEELTKRE